MSILYSLPYTFLQQYWWIVVALLGALLVFLMFVQGANALIFFIGKDEPQRLLMVNSTGRKWELAFTTLVVFGGAFFASFPLFYSTSFSGAYWVWIILLFTFVFQAVSYEYQNKKGNLIGHKSFQVFLTINGILAPIIVGAAVGTFFTGSNFVVQKAAFFQNILNPGGVGAANTISHWTTAWHGLEALTEPLCLTLGLTVLTLDMLLGCLYMLINIDDKALRANIKKYLGGITIAFLVFLLASLALLLTMKGYAVDPSTHTVSMESFKYLHNLIQMPIVLVMFLVGAVLVLVGLFMAIFKDSKWGIAPSGVGTVLVVLVLFFLAGFNNTAYYPSYPSADIQSSLTIYNSSSSYLTLKVMFYVSLLVPFVLAYIVYFWRQMDKKPITRKEIGESEDVY